jgi:poly(hydroxyalkanoate) depolymerase family esterase
MNGNMNQTMQDAMRLMQTGDLQAATQAIQRGLAGSSGDAQPAPAPTGAPLAADWLEGVFTVVPPTGLPGQAPLAPNGNEQARSNPSQHGTFREHRFAGDAGTLAYKLFVPAGRDIAGLPLIVMLHGCTQSPDDFARGTRMNALAQEHGYVVAYPAQTNAQNANRCWNWFRAGDQQRGKGEPALLVGLTRQIVAEHKLDEQRVYVAGLSAGGAMAAVLGGAYPDVFAAVGIHSGLPVGSAHDVPSAFAAMKRQALPGATLPGAARGAARIEAVPAIVFHGDRDATVDPGNGAAVVEQFTAAAKSSPDAPVSLQSTVARGTASGGRGYTRTTFKDASEKVVVEQWLVHGGGHAWFGGDRSGSYADPAGPDASAEMIRFFEGCRRATAD